MKKRRRVKSKKRQEERKRSPSLYSLLNLILSTGGCVVFGLSMTQVLGNAPYPSVYLSLYLYISVPSSILGLLLTLALGST